MKGFHEPFTSKSPGCTISRVYEGIDVPSLLWSGRLSYNGNPVGNKSFEMKTLMVIISQNSDKKQIQAILVPAHLSAFCLS